MKALTLKEGTSDVQLVDFPEPKITGPKDVKLKVLEVGICGTDREEVSGGRVDFPTGDLELIIGHEMLGKVVAIGDQVSSVQVGDYAVLTVRRGCGKCNACRLSRADMCYTGQYRERGIKELNGYQAEYVIDQESFIIKIPKEIVSIAVLTEPMSVIEKAIDEAVRIQIARLPDAADPSEWLRGKQVLISGLGPIGLLAAVALRLRGAKAFGVDIVDENTSRPTLFKQLGGHYIDGRVIKTQEFSKKFGQIDVILEATGIASLDFDLLSILGINGLIVLTGIPTGHRPIDVDGASLMQQLVLHNQIMIGSVNASEAHFQRAVDDLLDGKRKWPGVIEKLITQRISYNKINDVLKNHPADEIKSVIVWDGEHAS